MTRKEYINQVMDLATIFLRRDDHENYRKCVEIIADIIAEQYEYDAEHV